jgi:homoserine dehydrogenase
MQGHFSPLYDRWFMNCAISFDCTADETIGAKHTEWLKKGVHVVTANNTALSGSKETRQRLKDIEKEKKAKYLREVTVGGGLPVSTYCLKILFALVNIYQSTSNFCR